MKMKLSGIGLFCVVLFCSLESAAQKKAGFHTVSLNNLGEFDPATSNWKLAKSVFFSPDTDEKRFEPGVGIVLALPVKPDTGHLFTRMQHGDIELEFDFAVAKQSNSGVYLQGRYEVQIFDSWGVATPAFYDCGGIYQRWNESRVSKKGFEGKVPAQNACKAPGTWQHFKIVFQSPRFDKKGQKTANAKFIKVQLNDVVIHENVEVTGPTRSAAFEDERPTGPLMFQGDHGPVAIRNIRYTLLQQK
ncbi:3-keto-disaccharide hydrolase [Dyadobacter sediminis]|uniref:DUF1080 domain-containing protein n=1 Tax=Dyadobacter sediminis TaxID=1493691 RepID=A0A5R9KBD4_9BACT|nr:DUF1080 domain-containing protein [Dyadobacter sediminis]TLU92075.1 DUF1080 domain-containing protein [Dyadobacter sediminis]GGB97642.1 hypothetical protein GCM10011325_26220 [Dyadobacter sediminis]